MLKRVLLLQVFILFIIAGCETSDITSDTQNSNNTITLPDVIDGEIDTYWEFLISDQVECDSPDVCELFKRGAMDSYLGDSLHQARLRGSLPLTIQGLTEEEYLLVFFRSRKENTEWLKQRIKLSGWFDRNTFGDAADDLAFIIVQHSDHDVDFQIETLELLKSQLAKNGTKAQNVAYLSDRVARAENTAQLYGTQGQCESKGKWVPIEVIEPEDVDNRRAEVGLKPLQNYIESNSRICP